VASATSPTPFPHSAGSTALVVDLLTATKLVPGDRLAAARARVRDAGELPDALAEEGLATREGLVRMRASRFGLRGIDLAEVGVDDQAARLYPQDALERLTALPFELDESGAVLHVAVADPGDLYGLDALRLGVPYRIEFFVADRDDILREIRMLARRGRRA